MRMRTLFLNVAVWLLTLPEGSGFLSERAAYRSPSLSNRLSNARYLLPADGFVLLETGNSFWTAAVETFDGSTVVDPVIVSDVFWTSLASRVISVIIGQFLAMVAFAGVATVASSQLSQLADWVTSTSKQKQPDQRAVQEPVKKREVAEFVSNVRTADVGKLLVCIVIDILGSSSELLPILGEATDVLYAPIAALLLRELYGSNVASGLEFVEEILPFTDIIPLATICWIVDTYYPDSEIARLLQLGKYSTRVSPKDVEDAIDVNNGQGSSAKPVRELEASPKREER